MVLNDFSAILKRGAGTISATVKEPAELSWKNGAAEFVRPPKISSYVKSFELKQLNFLLPVTLVFEKGVFDMKADVQGGKDLGSWSLSSEASAAGVTAKNPQAVIDGAGLVFKTKAKIEKSNTLTVDSAELSVSRNNAACAVVKGSGAADIADSKFSWKLDSAEINEGAMAFARPDTTVPALSGLVKGMAPFETRVELRGRLFGPRQGAFPKRL